VGRRGHEIPLGVALADYVACYNRRKGNEKRDRKRNKKRHAKAPDRVSHRGSFFGILKNFVFFCPDKRSARWPFISFASRAHHSPQF